MCFCNQKVFLEKILSLCSWYSDFVIHIFLKEVNPARILPPYQHIVSLLAGAITLDLTSEGIVLFNYLMNRSGNPSNIVFPPDRTISL